MKLHQETLQLVSLAWAAYEKPDEYLADFQETIDALDGDEPYDMVFQLAALCAHVMHAGLKDTPVSLDESLVQLMERFAMDAHE